MTTGRINQVATVGPRQGARQTINGARTERSSRRTRTTTQRSFSIVRSPRRPVGPPVGRSRRGPGPGRPLLSPSRPPLRGRNNLDVWHTVRISTARQPMEVNRRDACRTAGTLAPVAAGRLQDCLVSKRQRSSIESKPGSRSLDDVPTPDDGPTHAPTLANQRRPFCRLPCPVCTLHCRFTYIAKHRVAAFSQPQFTYRYICIPYDLA